MEEGPPRKQARLESDTEDGRSSNGDTTLSLEHDEQCPFPWSGSKSTGTRASGGNSVMTDERYADFQLLDEVHEDDNEDDDDNDADGQDTEDDYDYDSEVPEEEIDALLEEGLPEEMKGPRKRKRDAIIGEGEEAPYDEREKLVLIEKGNNHFEVLPEGWVQVTHNSGMPVYLHKQSRVCTMSKPYFLGQGSVRKHDIPLSAVPCLQYLKALREEIQSKEGNGEGTSEEKRDSGLDKTAHSSKDGGDSHALETGAGNEGVNKTFSSVLGLNPLEGNPTPPPALVVGNAKIETAVENLQQQSLEVEELREYCRKRFNFKAIKIIRFKSWAERRKYQKLSKRKDRPQLPEGTKLISLRRQEEDGAFTTTSKKEWIMNPKGKSYVCILHEYVQHALKKQPKYVFKEVENAATPYAATIIINDMPYSTGYGSSKKQAKTEAAKSTLEILLPELGKKIREESNTKGDADLSFFDEIRIEDPRVPELCNKTSELSPYSILLNCLQRNFGLNGANIESKLVTQKNQKNEFVMSVGKHTVQVQCKNKKDGKQRASQAILQKLHPHISSWGSLLRLYGNRSMQTMREKKAEEQEITLLQSNATVNQPNTSIINKLKKEMLKLQECKSAIQPIGKFMPPEDVALPSASGIDLNNVDL
ncbi:microprocessor complex subunit DGCR8 isoform X1 [Macrobrachium rosenbergii]|uniref:microprocessor complex subunit DGCR8 isoform X1 n=1 Tax=Macrobrachium rosenbergii TaxID=79674 RepID=UPI0034D53872